LEITQVKKGREGRDYPRGGAQEFEKRQNRRRSRPGLGQCIKKKKLEAATKRGEPDPEAKGSAWESAKPDPIRPVAILHRVLITVYRTWRESRLVTWRESNQPQPDVR